jgi:hypothetical protein
MRKEVKTMTYRKPEISILGDAAQFIEQIQQVKTGSSLEFSTGANRAVSPAYDLDE